MIRRFASLLAALCVALLPATLADAGTIITRGAASALGLASKGLHDPWFANNVIFLDHGSTATDVSKNPLTLTNTGVTFSTTDSPYPVGGAGSSVFNGVSTTNITLPAASKLLIGTGDFTVDLWAKQASPSTGIQAYVDCSNGGTTGTLGQWQIASNAGKLYMFYYPTSSTPVTLSSNTSLPANQWNHVALVRSGGVWMLFINGVKDTATVTQTGTIGFTGSPCNLGHQITSNTAYLTGSLADIRITNVARYTANFTPPTRQDPTQ